MRRSQLTPLNHFLAAERVGESGTVTGVDMTPEMVVKARANAERIGAGNVEFRLGEIERLPIADSVADVVISNCVINLSPDKASVFREAYRVLKPGGRIAIADVVAIGTMPEELNASVLALTGCVSGAGSGQTLEELLDDAGFRDRAITVNEASREFIREWLPDSGIEHYVASATLEAVKPAEGAEC